MISPLPGSSSGLKHARASRGRGLPEGLAPVCVETVFTAMFAATNRVAPARENPPIVLVHGLVIAGAYLYPLAALLAPKARVYVPDLPGYGFSAASHTLSVAGLADALAAFLDARGIVRAQCVGNSFGCQVLAEFALRHPGRVDRLVLQGLTVDPEARSARAQLIRLVRNTPYEAPSLGRLTIRDYRRAGLMRALKVARFALADRVEDKLPAITAPTLLVRGDKDPLMPEVWAERARDLLPDARLTVIAGGHAVHYTAPYRMMGAIAAFLGLSA